MTETQSLEESISTKQRRIADMAREAPTRVFTSLHHFIDMNWLREAFYRTRKDGAPGVDGQTWAGYEANLEENLSTLIDRFKSGRYRAPAVRRTYIPKGGKPGAKRPIGIPTLEDKVLQRAVVMLLEPIYEQDFLDCSHGFRPGRSAHGALDRLWKGLMGLRGGWVLEVDIKGYFDNIDKTVLRGFLDQRIRDGVVRRIIHKWLKAGVLEDGRVHYPEKGTPQGGVISPLLANIYLHEVMDKWYAEVVRPRMRGGSVLLRYADDLVLVFEREDDARRVYRVIGKRFGKYGLTLHPTKTRLVRFTRPRWNERRPKPKPGSFDFLGFTHYWGRSRRGTWIVKRRTAKDRLRRALRSMHQFCKAVRHRKVRQQHQWIRRKLVGHYAYYGITNNWQSLARYRHQVERIWRYWLNNRGQRKGMPWERFREGILKVYPLPRPKIYHSSLARS